MNEYPVSERVERLRERAIQDSLAHPLPFLEGRTDYRRDDRYGWDDRQLMLFYEAWEREYARPTTLLRRYAAEAEMIRNLPVCVFDDDLICGRPDQRPLDAAERERFECLRERNTHVSPQVLGRTGHMSLDYAKLLRLGIEGLLDECDRYDAELGKASPLERVGKHEFYESVRLQLKALLDLEDRYVAEARKRGLDELADLMDRVPRKCARTFHEALQAMHFFSFVLRDLFSCGHPDIDLIDYYRRDIESGALTEERALELIDCWNIQYTFYTRKTASISYMIGGRDADGTPVENELTWLFLQSIAHVRLAYPSVGLALTPETNPVLLDYAIGLLSRGLTHPALFNEDAIAKSLTNRGVAPKHARLFVHSTCVEITPCGCSGFWATSPYHNCAKILTDLLGKRRDFANLAELEAAYRDALFEAVRHGQEEQDLLQLERLRNGGESPLASCLVNDCIRRGKNIDQGGALYNHVLPDFIGASNVIDSFAAIDTLVFKEKRLTLDELFAAMKADFAGQEPLRQYIVSKCPHFGNDDVEMNALAKRFYAMLAESCKGYETIRGGKVYSGAFSFMMHEDMGKETMATPDGRKAGEALNGGSDPVSGRDVKGPTASLMATTEWNHADFPGGVAVNLRLGLRPDDSEQRKRVAQLVRTFLARGGFELQINSVSVAGLEDAMVHPERHADLLVRVGGYSDFFVRQSPQLQREILARTCHAV